MAASYYGIARTTIDVDFIVKASPRQMVRLLDLLDDFGLEVDRERIKRQLTSEYKIISLQDRNSHNRADFMIQTGKLQRIHGRALGLGSFYQSPESLILAKLRMIKATRPVERSYKDREDIRQILAHTVLNRRGLVSKARREGTMEIMKDILDASSPRRVKTQRKRFRSP